MPLQRRLPKRGFKNPFRGELAVINVRDLAGFAAASTVDREALKQAGLVKGRLNGVKLLAEGEIQHPLVVRVERVSTAAREKIEAAGGKVELV